MQIQHPGVFPGVKLREVVVVVVVVVVKLC